MRRRNRPIAGDVERRFVTSAVELRAREAGDDSIGFVGHAAVFDRRTWIGPPKWGFWETIRRGAFRDTIREDDIRMLFNHDPNLPLARNTISEGPGSLRLSEDDVGLRDEADMTPTSYARDLATNIEAGVVTQQSFAFQAIDEEWSTDPDTGEESRELIVARVFDVSPVTFPAFTDTDASLRAVGFNVLLDALELDGERRTAIIAAVRSGEIPAPLAPALRAAKEALEALIGSSDPVTNDGQPAGTPRLNLVASRMQHLTDMIGEDLAL